MLMTKEHYDLMGQFEREHRGRRMDRESKESWPRGIIYQDGHVNELFAAYRRGYAFAVADYRSDLQNLEASRDGYRRDAERLQTEIDTLKSSKAEQSEECTPPASAQPGSQREGHPHDDPRFVALCREHDILGTAMQGLAAVFWREGGSPAPSAPGDAQDEDDSIALDKLADYIADTWPDKKYGLEEICQRLHAMWPGEFIPLEDLSKNLPNVREALRALLTHWQRFQASDGNQQDAYNLMVKGARLAWKFAEDEINRVPVHAPAAGDALQFLADTQGAFEFLTLGGETRYRIWWPYENERQDDWFDSPQEAIDAALAAQVPQQGEGRHE